MDKKNEFFGRNIPNESNFRPKRFECEVDLKKNTFSITGIGESEYDRRTVRDIPIDTLEPQIRKIEGIIEGRQSGKSLLPDGDDDTFLSQKPDEELRTILRGFFTVQEKIYREKVKLGLISKKHSSK